MWILGLKGLRKPTELSTKHMALPPFEQLGQEL